MILDGSQVHVWKINLEQETQLAHMKTCLSIDEQLRAESFGHAKSRDAYIVSRFALRDILGKYVGEKSSLIKFSYGKFGKPFFSESMYQSFEFNLSHSGAMALLGICRDAAVGVDIEKERTIQHLEQLVHRFFSPSEISEVLEVEAHNRGEKFFKLWTAKESFLKAKGLGLSGLLQKSLKEMIREDGGKWRIHSLFLEHGYFGSLCVDKARMNVSYLEWNPHG